MKWYFEIAHYVFFVSLAYQIASGITKENYNKSKTFLDNRILAAIATFIVEIIVALTVAAIWPIGIPAIISSARKRF
jgi:hypothetical protein